MDKALVTAVIFTAPTSVDALERAVKWIKENAFFVWDIAIEVNESEDEWTVSVYGRNC